MLTLFFMIAVSSNLFAIGCPSKCVAEEGVVKTGYCGDADGPEGGRECSSSGTGTPTCTGTYTPVQCTVQ